MLVPERRMNKNGVWSTKYVKPANAKAQASVPPPSLAPVRKAKVVRKVAVTAVFPRQMRSKGHIEYPFSFKPDERLVAYLKSTTHNYPSAKSDDFYWRATELATYDVLSVTAPENAVPLINAGIKSADDAVTAVSAAGCTDLIIDESELVQEAINMGLPTDSYIEYANTTSNRVYLDNISLAERMRKEVQGPLNRNIPGITPAATLQSLIDSGELSKGHVNLIGTERLYGALDADGLLIAELIRMHDGTSAYSPADLDEFISDYYLVDKKSAEYTKKYVYTLASRHGGDYIRTGPRDTMRMIVRTDFSRLATQRWGYNAEQERDFIAFGEETNEEVARLTNAMPNIHNDDYKALFEAGVSSHDIARGKQAGINAVQIIAMHNGTHPGVSSGWL